MRPNDSGHRAEDILAGILRVAGCTFDRQVEIGHTIYGGKLRIDFVIRNLSDYPNGLAVESKWQDCGGTADEKFPYLVENLRRLAIPSVIVIYGGGCREGALEWLRDHCDGVQVRVFQLEEFISWLLRRPSSSATA